MKNSIDLLQRRSECINRIYPQASTLSYSNADKYIDVVNRISSEEKREKAATILLDLDITYHTLCIVPPNYASLKSTNLDFILSNIKNYSERYDEFIRFTTNNPDLPLTVEEFANRMQEERDEHQKWLASYLVAILKTVAQDSNHQLEILLKDDPFSPRFDKEKELTRIEGNIRKMLNRYDEEFATMINNNPANKEIIAAYQSLVEVSNKISDIQLEKKINDAEQEYDQDNDAYKRISKDCMNPEKTYKITLHTIERFKASINRSLDELKQLLEHTKSSHKVTASSDNHDQHHQLIKKLEELIAKVSAIVNGYDTLAKSVPRDNQQSSTRAARSEVTPRSSPLRRDQDGSPYSSPLRRNQDESSPRRTTSDAISILERSKNNKNEAAEPQNRSNIRNSHNSHS